MKHFEGLCRGLLVAALLSACQPPGLKSDGRPEFFPAERELIYSLSPLGAPPANPTNAHADDAGAARLGQWLFYQPRFSAGGRFSCASCHNPALGWTDGRARAQGLQSGPRNSPTLWNVGQQRWLFWDGHADTLWAQALGPLENPLEMGFSRVGLYRAFYEDPQLRAAYQRVFGPLPEVSAPLPQQARPGKPEDPLAVAWRRIPAADRAVVNRVAAHFGKALEAYERRLNSGESPFDRFVRGLRKNDDAAQQALDRDAQLGLRLFIGRGQCILCHSGPNFSDGEFHNLGLPALAGSSPDSGRFDGIPRVLADDFNGIGPFSDLADADDAWADKLHFVARAASNRGEFKTPTLREISHTAPYMHDGRFASLEEVLAFYNAPQVFKPASGRREDTLQPLQLSADEMRQLKAFLVALDSGPPPAELTRPPALGTISETR